MPSHAGDLTGKIVTDATNPLAADLSGPTVGAADSAGELKGARLLDQFVMLWIASAYKFGFGRDFAFSVVRK